MYISFEKLVYRFSYRDRDGRDDISASADRQFIVFIMASTG